MVFVSFVAGFAFSPLRGEESAKFSKRDKMNAHAMRYVCRVIESLESTGEEHAASELQGGLQSWLEASAMNGDHVVDLASLLCLLYGIDEAIA